MLQYSHSCILHSLAPLPIAITVFHFLVSPVLLWHSFVSTVLSVVLFAVSMGHYHYLNFLGYSALPFLERTEVRAGARMAYLHKQCHGAWHSIAACCVVSTQSKQVAARWLM